MKKSTKGLGIGNDLMTCARCGVMGGCYRDAKDLGDWAYVNVFTLARRWSAFLLCDTCYNYLALFLLPVKEE